MLAFILFFVVDITSLETLGTTPLGVWIEDPYIQQCPFEFGPKFPFTNI